MPTKKYMPKAQLGLEQRVVIGALTAIAMGGSVLAINALRHEQELANKPGIVHLTQYSGGQEVFTDSYDPRQTEVMVGNKHICYNKGGERPVYGPNMAISSGTICLPIESTKIERKER